MQYTIRDYRIADLDGLWRIEQRCFPRGMAFTQEELTGYLSRREAFALVAETAGNAFGTRDTAGGALIAGFLAGERVRRAVGHLIALDIVPEARRCGLATRLMGAGERRLQLSGCTQVLLETAVDNTAALPLYRKLGYVILDTLPRFYPGPGLSAHRLGKRLGRRGASAPGPLTAADRS